MNERELYEQTCPSRNKWDGGRYDVAADQMAWEAWQARARIAEQREAELVRLLKRYRHETPLGHQPHMIAAEVDGILATHESHKGGGS